MCFDMESIGWRGISSARFVIIRSKGMKYLNRFFEIIHINLFSSVVIHGENRT